MALRKVGLSDKVYCGNRREDGSAGNLVRRSAGTRASSVAYKTAEEGGVMGSENSRIFL